jgi:hypothetical protein
VTDAQQARLLPDSVAERLVAFYNREPTLRLAGDARIGAGTALRGDVAVLGNLVVDGVVEGDVVVINGVLDVRPGARIGGRATVAGGEARVAQGAAVTAACRRTASRCATGSRATSSRMCRRPWSRGWQPAWTCPSAGRTCWWPPTARTTAWRGCLLPSGPASALPARTPSRPGPSSSPARPRRRNWSRVASATTCGRSSWWRRHIGVTLGARLYSEIADIEGWGLSDREASLAAFVLHRDYRDYYERDGWSVYAALQRPGAPWRVQLEYRDEEHGSRAGANPLTIVDNGGPVAAAAHGGGRDVAHGGGVLGVRQPQRAPGPVRRLAGGRVGGARPRRRRW